MGKNFKDEIRINESRYIRIVRAIFKVCRKQCAPLYSNKYSSKGFALC